MALSLRARIVIGSVLWTLGVLLVVSTLLVWALLHHRSFPYRVHQVLEHTALVPIVAALCMAGGFLLVRRGLAPIVALRTRVARLRDGAASRIDGAFPSEVAPLVDDLNALLAHRERAVSRAVAKAGDLAHGLKTPLALLSQDADRAEAAGQPELAASIRQQADRMRRQIDYHLAHARAAASGATPGAVCAVDASAQALARTLARLHAERAVAIEVACDAGHTFRGEREDLDEMLGNLMDNACKWARSRARVSSASGDTTVAITVDDDGPGLDASMVGAVLQRGVRADESAPGTGLGLAIVRDLAELYGGSIALGPSPLGGVRATLTLPSN
ncbi:MAG TPA: ATP-binding protein [Vicinamibacterales bacterium]|nr:ATP-binding protein [Vicinamibacterales bacterium]